MTPALRRHPFIRMVGISIFITSIALGIVAWLLDPLYIAVPVISEIDARTNVQRDYKTGSWPSMIGLAVGGCILMIVMIVILVFVVGIGIFSIDALSQF